MEHGVFPLAGEKMIEKINLYFGWYYYPICLVIFLFILLKNKSVVHKKLLVAIMIFTIIYPGLYYGCVYFDLEEESYRLFWSFPLQLIAAGVFVAFVRLFSQNRQKQFIFIAILMILFLFGNQFLQKGSIYIPDNEYGVQDEILELSELIENDMSSETDYVNVVGELDFMIKIRLISPNIHWAYGRGYMMNANEKHTENAGYRTAGAIQAGYFYEGQDVLQDLRDLDVDYLVVYKENEILNHIPEEYLRQIGETENYLVLAVDNNKPYVQDFNIDEEEIVISDMTGEYSLVVINDMHINVPNEEITEDDLETVETREASMTFNSKSMADNWESLPLKLDSLNADAIILNGDMIDYFSTSNFTTLRNGLNNLQTPYMYLRADHDLCPWWTSIDNTTYISDMESELDGNPEVEIMEWDEFQIVGINQSTSQISENAYEQVERAFAKGKPVILVSHVPYDSQISDGLANASKEVWQNRVLLWGRKTPMCQIILRKNCLI
jgi:hypothetical protein